VFRHQQPDSLTTQLYRGNLAFSLYKILVYPQQWEIIWSLKGKVGSN
jgi:hypothetical protein